MNNTINELNNRKSVRVYENREIESDKKQAILNAALQAPTAGNMALYTIIDVTDSDLKKKLSVSCDNQPFIASAPMVLVFCADYRRWYKLFCSNTDNVRALDVGDLMLANADAIIAAQNSVVAAESLGIGSCYIGDIIENYEIQRELLNLPDYVVPACMLCFGYPTNQQKSRAKPPRFEIEDMVFENEYDMQRSDNFAAALSTREKITDADEFCEWVKRFCERKYNSDFSIEMSRSARKIIAEWTQKEV